MRIARQCVVDVRARIAKALHENGYGVFECEELSIAPRLLGIVVVDHGACRGDPRDTSRPRCVARRGDQLETMLVETGLVGPWRVPSRSSVVPWEIVDALRGRQIRHEHVRRSVHAVIDAASIEGGRRSPRGTRRIFVAGAMRRIRSRATSQSSGTLSSWTTSALTLSDMSKKPIIESVPKQTTFIPRSRRRSAVGTTHGVPGGVTMMIVTRHRSTRKQSRFARRC